MRGSTPRGEKEACAGKNAVFGARTSAMHPHPPPRTSSHDPPTKIFFAADALL